MLSTDINQTFFLNLNFFLLIDYLAIKTKYSFSEAKAKSAYGVHEKSCKRKSRFKYPQN